MRRVLLPALALLVPPVDCRLGQQMVPPEDQLLRSCVAEPTVPAVLRNATPLDALVMLDSLSDCAGCSAKCFGIQPAVLGFALSHQKSLDGHRRFERWRCACPRHPRTTESRCKAESLHIGCVPVTRVSHSRKLARQCPQGFSSNWLVKSRTVPIRPQKSFFVAQLSPTHSVNTPHDHTTRPVAI